MNDRHQYPPQGRPGEREYRGPGDKRPRPHEVSRQQPPMAPSDATGINPKERRPIDPRMPYLPPP